MNAPHEPIAVRVYRFLLRMYPRAFRAEYAAEMALDFRDAYYAARRHGIASALRFWLDVLGDFVTSVSAQRLQRWLVRGTGSDIDAERVALAAPFFLQIGSLTDIGRMRASNEDTLLTVVPEDNEVRQKQGALFVVADGMGGDSRGDVASAMATRIVRETYYAHQVDDIPSALQTAFNAANLAIFQARPVTGAQHMGATCAAAIIHGDRLYAANVGDSRIYILHDGELRQITRDHSLVAQMIERGEITPEAARTHPQRHIIYRALGSKPTVEVDIFFETVTPGDVVLLCTDGLSGVLSDAEIWAIIEDSDPAAGVNQLIARANAAGGPDNVTAIIARVGDA